MKFSWKSLNYFIDLSNITINELADLLTIRGFEIDHIEHDINSNDYTLDIDVTSNRTDTLSIIGLAQELSHILNKKLISYNSIFQYQTFKKTQFNISNFQNLSKIHINKIINIQNIQSPQWLVNYLKIHNIGSYNLLYDIQEYIKLKWGQEIYFFYNINTIKKNNKIEKSNNQEYNYIFNNIKALTLYSQQKIKNIEYTQNSQPLILCSYYYSKQSYKQLYFNDAHNEALQILATFSRGYISKSYIYSNSKDKFKNIILKINKNTITNTLGPINFSKTKYLCLTTIYKILKQLNLKPKYNYYTKNFEVSIPTYRTNDLYRNIDIIEEIGRIYGYEHFIDKIPFINKKGKISQIYLLMQSIRKYFRNHGLHEIVNSSFNKNDSINLNHHSEYSNIYIYNPVLQEQSQLKCTLVDNLMQNIIYNYKQKNNYIEIFEIGKVFIKNKNQNSIEEQIHLTGILTNSNFIKQSWQDDHYHLNWFHAKGMLEEFFELFKITISWKSINEINKNDIFYLPLKLFNIKETVFITNLKNDQVIGMLGTINIQYYKSLPKNESIYSFILNLTTLQNAYFNESHLSYTFSNYSLYPSVTRDISIKVSKQSKISEIQQQIYRTNTQLIKKIDILNEYANKKYPNYKFISLRILYNSHKRTLNNDDLTQIDSEINKILKEYK